MKQVEGIWFPDYETHLPSKLGIGVRFAGGATYQFSKFAACFPLIRQFGHVVDVGAHVGLWSRVFERCFDKVTAFDPVPAHRDCFVRNVPKRPGVVFHQCALGEAPGEVNLMVHSSSSAKTKVASKLVPKAYRYWALVAEVKTLDSFDLAPIDFLKIDVEGFEYFVLKGGEQTILRDKPLIIIEQKQGNGEHYGLGPTQAIELLRSWGAEVVADLNGDFIMKWA